MLHVLSFKPTGFTDALQCFDRFLEQFGTKLNGKGENCKHAQLWMNIHLAGINKQKLIRCEQFHCFNMDITSAVSIIVDFMIFFIVFVDCKKKNKGGKTRFIL